MGASSQHPNGSPEKILDEFRKTIQDGHPWPEALMDAMASWPAGEEVIQRKRYHYFIAGEAFDWMLLSERIFQSVEELVPAQEREAFIANGTFPAGFDEGRLKERLGVEKHRGYLNYFYGVTVEHALQLSVEEHTHKRLISNGVRYRVDLADEAFKTIYGGSVIEMLDKFRTDTRTPRRKKVAMEESKAFTYWLFKYRVKKSDPARLASDTKRGLDQLRKMRAASLARQQIRS